MTLRAVVIGAGWAGEGHTPRPARRVLTSSHFAAVRRSQLHNAQLSLVLPMCAWIGGRHWTNCSLIL